LHDLRATAWKERAGALTVLGEYAAAFVALDHAHAEFSLAPSAPLGAVIVEHARAIIHYYRGELDHAIRLAADSASAYAALGESGLCMRARHLSANIAFAAGNIRKARSIYEDLLAQGDAENDLTWIARESNTVGRCSLELGELDRAAALFRKSAETFDELGSIAEGLRPQWGLALVLLRSGNAVGALARLKELRSAFQRHGMLSDEALITLDVIDALHCLRRDVEGAEAAREVMHSFTRAGMLTSALSAFAYLKEAAQHGIVAPQLTRHVRSFLGRLEREPALLFRPPGEKI
jgi:tetratricopeptide (TPR) repeat protein